LASTTLGRATDEWRRPHNQQAKSHQKSQRPLVYLVDVKLSVVVECTRVVMQEDEVDGVKKPLRALGPVTDAPGRTKFRNPIVCLVLTRAANIHIPATSACASCSLSRARTCFCPYDATATLVSRQKSFKRDPDLDESVERGWTDSSTKPYSVSRRPLRPVTGRSRASCRTTHRRA
jgi:hypothetical protein